MHILLTGGLGFIGSAVVRRLIATTDHVVVNLDKETYAASHEALDGARGHRRHVHIKADICDAAAMAAAFAEWQPEVVMHLAAESHVDRSITDPGAFIRTNVIGTQVMLDAARGHYEALQGEAKARFRFLHVSTDEVYGSLPPDAFFTPSEVPPTPVTMMP